MMKRTTDLMSTSDIATHEEIIKSFYCSADKERGEFLTPPDVIRMFLQILEPENKVYDPTMGSGDSLIQLSKYVKKNLKPCKGDHADD